MELFPEPRKLGAQFKYADRRGHSLAIVVGDDEWERGVAQLKQKGSKQSQEVSFEKLPAICLELLGR